MIKSNKIYTFLLVFLWLNAASQDFGAINFTELPKNLQLFTRNEANIATFDVAGQVNVTNFAQVVSILYRKDKIVERFVQNTSNPKFAFKHTIKAELSNYFLKVFLKNTNDSLQIANIEKIVCGDAMMLLGQSNAAPYNINYQFGECEFCRSYGINVYDNSQLIPYSNDHLFFNNGNGGLGVWMSEVSKKLINTYSIPLLVINGSLQGSSIDQQLERKYGTTSIYDRAMFRAVNAGVYSNLKAIFYRQGEAESGFDPTAFEWPNNFTKLVKFWREDYGPKPLIYLAQIDLQVSTNEGSGYLRDFQRKAKDLFPNLTNFTAIGTKNYDGIHYGVAGHLQTADEVFRIVAKDLYGETKDTANIESARIQKIYFSKDRMSINMIFQEGQKLLVQKDTLFYSYPKSTHVVYKLKDHFILNGPNADKNDTLIAENNKLVLRLNAKGDFNKISYLPNGYNRTDNFVFPGPFLVNEKGMRAFAFQNYPIADYIPDIANFEAKYLGKKEVILSWAPNIAADMYYLYRSNAVNGNFVEIKKINDKNATLFIDKNVEINTTYYYKIMAKSATSISDFSTTQSVLGDYTAPSILKAEAIDSKNIELSWSDNSSDEDSFELEIADNVEFSKSTLLKVKKDTNAVKIDKLEPSKIYFFRIKALRANGKNSNLSNTANAVTCPMAVTDFKYDITDYKVNLYWKESIPDEESFEIEMAIDSGAYKTYASVKSNSIKYTTQKLEEGVNFSFKIRAVNKNGCRSEDQSIKVYMPIFQPTELKGKLTADTEITLNWRDNSNHETGYNIYKSIGSEYTKLVELPVNAKDAILKGLDDGENYILSIGAKNSNPEDSKANSVNLVTKIAKPTNLTISEATAIGVTLAWQDNSKFEKNFILNIKPENESEKDIKIDKNVKSILLTDLKSGTNYTFKVLSENDIAGKSEFSNEVTAKTLNIVANEDDVLANNFSVFPNPTQNVLNVSVKNPINTKATLSIINAKGHKLFTAFTERLMPNQNMKVQTESFSAGIYWLEIEFSGKKFYKKFFKN